MEEIVDRVATGSKDRVREAWVAHHERLWRSVAAWSGDLDVAGEAVAEAFAQALRRGDAIDDIGRWVWRAAFRIAGGLLLERNERQSSLRPPNPDRTSDPVDAETLPDDVVVLLDALAHLGREDRAVVVLSLVGGWSSSEIGEIVDSAAGTVRVRLHRAKARLRSCLEDSDG